MNKVSDDFIQYTGINSKISSNLEDFTQFNVSSNFYIPKNKKDIEQISKVHVSVDIIETHIVKTPKGKSFEGQVLTGYKLFASIEINIKIEYICDDENNSVQYITHKIPSSAYVVIDEDYDDCLSTYPSIIVEDIYCKMITKRKIYFNVSLISVVNIF